MSSLAAARADNFYYPPEWEPKRGGLNKFHGTHSLGVRAKRIKEGIIVVRFEMPYNVWCEGCGVHIGRGVRYNANKSKAGKYFSTTIWEFDMKCAQCPQRFIIRTDPKNADYEFVSGCHRKKEDFEAADAELPELADDAEKDRLATDSMYRLEHQHADERKAVSEAERLEELIQLRDRDEVRDDINATLRRKFRGEKADMAEKWRRGEARGIGIALLDADPKDDATGEDATALSRNRFASFRENAAAHRRSIVDRPIMEDASTTSTTSTTSAISAISAASVTSATSASASTPSSTLSTSNPLKPSRPSSSLALVVRASEHKGSSPSSKQSAAQSKRTIPKAVRSARAAVASSGAKGRAARAIAQLAGASSSLGLGLGGSLGLNRKPVSGSGRKRSASSQIGLVKRTRR